MPGSSRPREQIKMIRVLAGFIGSPLAFRFEFPNKVYGLNISFYIAERSILHISVEDCQPCSSYGITRD
jgi:hypothetical protein